MEKDIFCVCEKSVVAIVDSGISSQRKDLVSSVIGGINFNTDYEFDMCYEDKHGHGTLCASVIKRMNPNVKIYVVRILDENALTTSSILLRALRHLLTVDVRVINLSVATMNIKYKNELSEVCGMLRDQGKILVSSLQNREIESLPAIFDSVIGVKGAAFKEPERYWLNYSYKINCIANAVPILLQGMEENWDMFGGNSKATAVFSGIILQRLSVEPQLTNQQLLDKLAASAEKNEWDEEGIEDLVNLNVLNCIICNSQHPYLELELMKSIVAEVLELDEGLKPKLHNYKLYHPYFNLSLSKCLVILKKIEMRFSIKIKKEKITYYDFESIYSLLDLVL